MSFRRVKGFTLIELLVVIAVIGILAGLMFPAIGGVIERAQATQVANKGKNIVTMIVSANLTREANSDTSLWPEEGTELLKNDGSTLNTVTCKASEYFDALLRGGPGKDGYLEGLNAQLFAGAGVPMARGGEVLTSTNNVWKIIAKIGNPEGDPPFMFTRSFKPMTSVANVSLWGGDWEDTDPWNKPFGKNRVVVVSRGSSTTTIERRDLTWARFGFGSSVTNLYILEP